MEAMIKNEREYRITKSQIAKFKEAVEQISKSPPAPGVHPEIHDAEKRALESQLFDLEAQVDEYEDLKAGKTAVVSSTGLHDLPRMLIRARIAAGLSHKDLADRLGMKEQQIQRYEANDYSGASLERIKAVMESVGLSLTGEFVLPTSSVDEKALLQKLDEVGLDEDLIVGRVLPPALAASFKRRAKGAQVSGEATVAQAASYISSLFGWRPSELFGRAPLTLSHALIGAGRFKLPKNATESRTRGYAAYARMVAVLAAQAAKHLPARPVDITADSFRADVMRKREHFGFEEALRSIWELGVVVLPLATNAAFHGACWRFAGRNVIVLTQTTDSASRWLFDLLHEFKHAGEAPERAEHSVIEASPIDPTRADSPSEEAANEFARDVLLDGRDDELEALCESLSQGQVQSLKRVVAHVAEQEGVHVGVLANHIAYRLQDQGINWWGTANALQPKTESPQETAKKLFWEYVRSDALPESQHDFVVRALAEGGA
jgi:transcriptional regulator with XRE-family HTH domain/Zn-dependent peptidase ImmA (M78 family)